MQYRTHDSPCLPDELRRAQTSSSNRLAWAQLRSSPWEKPSTQEGPSFLSVILRCREITASLTLLSRGLEEALIPFPGQPLSEEPAMQEREQECGDQQVLGEEAKPLEDEVTSGT